ncbi:hypothetical protein NC652_009922 [Populus alba x Populus x berolinensis]|uniref:Uncharacterized protein n=1 Tax=Populus alba x Populus x berolinensis TaxID=444605 RepID=A0AAD6RAC0_9ROSI|nr:hypothetical protein NC652_009922 [Populus alba x Populus x berolinensis]KAJ7005295.1 hypothetical protein NC653_009943 [Populus alba x Populus x berolinensis]
MAEVIIPLSLHATVPITHFVFLQFPLLVQIFMSAYGPSIFNRNIKNRY